MKTDWSAAIFALTERRTCASPFTSPAGVGCSTQSRSYCSSRRMRSTAVARSQASFGSIRSRGSGPIASRTAATQASSSRAPRPTLR